MGQTEPTCIFKDYITTATKVTCSPMKTAGIRIICDTHARELLRFVPKQEVLVPISANSSPISGYVLNFVNALEDEFLPFPFKLNEKGDFCIDKTRLESAQYNSSKIIPVLATIASSGITHDITYDTRYYSFNLSQHLLVAKHTYDQRINNLASKIKVYVQTSEVDSTEVPLEKFPFFYKVILLYMIPATIAEIPKATAAAQNAIRTVVSVANIMVSTHKGSIDVINRSKLNRIFVNVPNVSTYATPMVLMATKHVEDLEKEGIFGNPAMLLQQMPSVCPT